MLQEEHAAILLTFIKLPFVYFWVAVLHRFYWTYGPKTKHKGIALYMVNDLNSKKARINMAEAILTHLSRMEFPTIMNWTSPFRFKGCKVVFLFEI